MRSRRRSLVSFAAVTVLLLGVAPPASAASQVFTGPGGCTVTLSNNAQRATTSTSGGACGTAEVRHYYTTSGGVFWTRWVYPSSPTVTVQSPTAATLNRSEHYYTINGVKQPKVTLIR